MRISKKYAGKSNGKQVFLSRVNVSSGRSITSDDSNDELKQLELQFHMSLIQEGSAAAAVTDVSVVPLQHNRLNTFPSSSISSWKGLENQRGSHYPL
jgi:hypothetical protein